MEYLMIPKKVTSNDVYAFVEALNIELYWGEDTIQYIHQAIEELKNHEAVFLKINDWPYPGDSRPVGHRAIIGYEVRTIPNYPPKKTYVVKIYD